MNKRSTFSKLASPGARFRCVLLSFFLLIFCVAAVNAQSVSSSTPVALAPGSPTGSYQLGAFDSVNFYSGSINFNLPLLTVSGRGSVQSQMMLPLTRRPWRVESYQDGNGNPHYFPTTEWWEPETRYGIPILAGRRGGSGEKTTVARPAAQPLQQLLLD